MNLSTKLIVSAAIVTGLFAANAWLDEQDATSQAALLRETSESRTRQTALALDLVHFHSEMEAWLPGTRPATLPVAGDSESEAKRLLTKLTETTRSLAEFHATPAGTTGPALHDRFARLATTWGEQLQAPTPDGPEHLLALHAAAGVALTEFLAELHEQRNADDADVLAYFTRHRRINAVILVVYAISIGLLFWLWHVDLIRPLHRLEQDARKVRTGMRTGLRLHYGRNDELGALVTSFNEAIDEVHSSTFQQARLERTVEERSLQLREREALLQRVIEGSGQGFWDWNIVTGKATFSGRWADMLGYRLDEIEHSAATWERLLHPDDRPAAVKAVWAHISGESPTYEVEHRMLTKTNEWKWVLTRGLIVDRDENGRAIHLSGTHTDIHDRKLAEQALRQREEQLRLVSDNFPEGALYQFVVGTDGIPRNTYIGDGFRRILGIERETPIGNWNWLDQHVIADDMPLLQQRHAEAIRHRAPFHIELRARSQSGELKWLSFRSHPRDGGDGTTVWDGVMIDITRLKLAETEIGQQADFYAALNTTTVELLNRRNRDDLLQSIVERTSFMLDVPHVELSLIEGEELVTRAYAGRAAGFLGDRATRAQARLSWRAIDSRQPAVTEDYSHMPGARDLYKAITPRAAAVFPILHGENCLGVLGLVRSQGNHGFTLGDLQKGQLLAQIVALVLHNSSIYADAVRIAENRMLALRESEARLREAQRIAHIGHREHLFDTPGEIELWSDETYRIFGLQPQSVAIDRARFYSFIHPGDLPRVKAAIAGSLENHAPLTLSYRIIRPDGEVRALSDSAELKRDEQGNVIGMQGIIQDITESAAAEASLRASELRFKRVVENISDALMVDDVEGRIVYANERFLEMFRLRAEDLPGRTIFDHAPPEQRESTRATHYARLAGAPVPSLLEIEALRADGTRFWAELRITSVIEDGRIIGSQAAIRDITERRTVDQTLRLLSTGTALLSGEAFFNYVVTRMTTLLGVDLALVAVLQPGPGQELRTVAYCIDGQNHDVTAMPTHGTLAGAVLRERVPILAESISQAFPQDQFLAAMGMTNVAAAPLTGAAGEVQGVVMVGSRQTIPNFVQADAVLKLAAVRLAAEIARDRNERRFRDLFDFAPDAIVMVQRSGLIGRVNRRAEALFGYQAHELAGQPFTLLVPGTAAEAERLLREQFDGQPRSRAMGEHADLTAQRKDGESFPAEISLGQVESEAGPLVAVAMRDITLQRRSEARLRESQKMESLGTLAGGIAHDFNNILTGMFGFVEMARLDLSEEHPARQWLNNIASAGLRAKNLVKQILTFSRQNEGERSPVDLNAVVAEALRLLRSTLPPMVRIDPVLAEGLPGVLADSTQLHQVIMNLGTNAWHAMPESGGTLSVSTAKTIVTEEMRALHPDLPKGEALRVVVADDGCGMTPAVLERMFEPFFTTKAAGRGTGLGLAVVHGVIRSHGGAILARSSPGEGTTFEIYLPAIQQTPIAEPDRSALPGGRGERLMLVDDDDVGRQALAALLKHIGYVVDDFEQPQVAFTRFAAQPSAYAAVLTDFAMPLVTGVEFTRQIRCVRPDIPVLLITGYVDPTQQAEMQRSGLRAVLRKPPTVEELALAVRRCLEPATPTPPTL